MRVILATLALVAGSTLLCSAATGQDNPPPKKKDRIKSREATPDDYKALGKMREVIGRLLSLDGSQQLTLKVDYPALEPKNKNGAPNDPYQRVIQAQSRQQQQAQREYQRILAIRNPIQRQQRLDQFFARQQAIAQQQANAALDPRKSPYKVVTSSVTFQLPIKENVKVARAKMELEYDDKGQIVEYTKEELQKKRDKDMPGYTAKFEDLQPGQLLKVYLHLKSKTADKDKAQAKEPVKDAIKEALEKADGKVEAGKAKDKATDAATTDVNPPEVRMILILTDADPNSLPRESTGKKKKNQ
jgi:hypothetical protein